MTPWNGDTLIIVVGLVAAFQLYVSGRLLFYRGYTVRQKLIQLLIVWLVPGLGAILVLSFLAADSRKRPKADTAFIPDGGNNPPGIS
jgi:hypothetical protein